MRYGFLPALTDYRTGILFLCLSFFAASALVVFEANSVRGIELLPTGFLFAGLAGASLLASSFVRELKILDVFAASTLLGYGLGAFNTYMNAEEFWLDYQVKYSNQETAFATIALDLYCLVLVILARSSTLDTLLVKKISTPLWNINRLFSHRLLQITLGITLIQIVLIVTGKAAVTGDFARFSSFSAFSSTTQGGLEKGILTFLYPIVAATSLLCGILMALLLRRKISGSWLLYSAFASNFIWIFLSGRRSVLYGLLTIFLGFCLATPLKERTAFYQSISLRKLLIIGAAISVLTFSFDFFSFMRIYNTSLSSSAAASQTLFTNISDGFFAYLDLISQPESSNYASFKESVDQNVSTRTFILEILTQALKVVSTKQPLMGLDFSGNLLGSLPSDFLIDKSKLLMNETLYNKVYNLGWPDISNSYLTSAIFDFSWFGVILYPLFFYSIFNLLIVLSMKTHSIWLYLLLLSCLLQIAFAASEAPLTLPFATMRNFVAILLCFVIARACFWKPASV